MSILASCSTISHKPPRKPSAHELSVLEDKQLYAHIAQEIRATHATHLKECNCMKAFYRDLFAEPDQTARYIFDKKVGEQAALVSNGKDTVSILAIGSGTLLNELTAMSHVLAAGKNLKIYLTDWSYVFYGDPQFEKNALRLGNNPSELPETWANFYFWAWAKNGEEPYLPFFVKHHQAIDEFKATIARLDAIYGTHSSVEVIKPPKDELLQLPPLDLIISIDAFIDLPNLMWNLFYQMKLADKAVRFVTLSKAKEFGGFWESPDLALREAYSQKPVSVDIYEVSGDKQQGAYRLIERSSFEPSQVQREQALEFLSDPKRDSQQSPFDVEEFRLKTIP